MALVYVGDSREAVEGLGEQVVGDPDMLECLRRDSGVTAWHERRCAGGELVYQRDVCTVFQAL